MGVNTINKQSMTKQTGIVRTTVRTQIGTVSNIQHKNKHRDKFTKLIISQIQDV